MEIVGMFFLKKIISSFLFPVSLCLAAQITGLALLWLTRKQKTGKLLVTFGTVLLLLLGYEDFSDLLLRGLESEYAALTEDRLAESGFGESLLGVRRIVVLGGGHTYDLRMPITSRISPSSMVRLVEGVRLHRKIPGSKIIVSGGAVHDPVSEAEEAGRLAVELGVDPEDILLERKSWDTEDQARLIKDMVGEEKFILVTSASHMPRAMALFEKRGMHPLPAPTDHSVKRSAGVNPRKFFPGDEGLTRATDAVREYLGLAWAKIRGQI